MTRKGAEVSVLKVEGAAMIVPPKRSASPSPQRKREEGGQRSTHREQRSRERAVIAPLCIPCFDIEGRLLRSYPSRGHWCSVAAGGCIPCSPLVLLGGIEEGFFRGDNFMQPSTLLLPLLIRRNKGEVGWVIAAAVAMGRLGSSTCCDPSLQPLFSTNRDSMCSPNLPSPPSQK